MITSNTRKKFEDFEYFQVPFTKNIHDYINEIHRETNHRGINSLNNELLKRKISYYGINKDIKYVVNHCHICN